MSRTQRMLTGGAAVLVVLAALVALVRFGGEQSDQPGAAATPAASAPSAPSAPSATVAVAASTASASAASPSAAASSPAGIEPVIDSDFPDPDVLQFGATYYAFSTEQPGGSNVRAVSSTDLLTWTDLPDALPLLPAWATEGRTWAPEVYQRDDKMFVLYFTARHLESDRQCIGAALSKVPGGPYEPTSEQPLICPLADGGAIDASSFREPTTGQRYILWKTDGNCCEKDTWIYLQTVSADGTKLTGKPVRLIKQDKAFEGTLVEAPTLWKQDSRYYLFYSANHYGDGSYVSSYATAATLTGPYQNATEPLMTTPKFGGEIIGPGGQDVFVAPDGSLRMALHGWRGAETYRGLYIRPLTFSDGKPVVSGADR